MPNLEKNGYPFKTNPSKNYQIDDPFRQYINRGRDYSYVAKLNPEPADNCAGNETCAQCSDYTDIKWAEN